METSQPDLKDDYHTLPMPYTPNESPSAAPVPKVWASSAGAGLGGAIGAVLVWVLQSTGLDVPQEVAVSIATICSILVGFAAGYLTPPRSA